MHLLVIRHAIAEEREEFARTGEDDDKRPLTARGIRRMRRGARGLRRVVPAIDVLASSPLVRAWQTAEIIAPVYDGIAIDSLDALKPDAPPSALRAWVRTRGDAETVAIVGHEPHLGALVSWLLAGSDNSFVELRKGGAALLELDRIAAPGSARLHWLLGAVQLRAMT
ncbi:MAG TPA: histidine phosphatase family protein [Gemmatimonadaceae bacterium]|nr:histidine phosphatase family protein [Gemmatimonadaceae bacterium]